MTRLRSRRVRALRGPLSRPEIAELLAGGPVPGGPSVFASAADFLAARSRLAVERQDWDKFETWLHEGAAHRITYQRHMAHEDKVPLPYPEWPAIVDTRQCPLCQADRS